MKNDMTIAFAEGFKDSLRLTVTLVATFFATIYAFANHANLVVNSVRNEAKTGDRQIAQ